MRGVTVKWLKAEIKKKCPSYSKLRKAELIDLAEALGIEIPVSEGRPNQKKTKKKKTKKKKTGESGWNLAIPSAPFVTMRRPNKKKKEKDRLWRDDLKLGYDDPEELKAIREAGALARSKWSQKDKQVAFPSNLSIPSSQVTTLQPRRKQEPKMKLTKTARDIALLDEYPFGKSPYEGEDGRLYF